MTGTIREKWQSDRISPVKKPGKSEKDKANIRRITIVNSQCKEVEAIRTDIVDRTRKIDHFH